MQVDLKLRRFSGVVSGNLFVISSLLAAFVPASATAQTGEPIKFGYSMSLTGGLAPRPACPEDLGGGYQCSRWTARSSREAYLLRRSNQSGDGTRHLYQAARRRQGRPDHRPLRH